MNIFALSKNPVEAARQMLDKHVVKMPTESCQMIHTNALYFQYLAKYREEPALRDLKQFHACSNSKLMKPAMLNHPSTIWARQNPHNADWLMQHALALCEEYTYRYGKTHGAYARILQTWGEHFMEEGCWKEASPVSIAMADEYRLDKTQFFYGAEVQYGIKMTEWDFVIASYRHYYLEGKWRFAEWRKNRRPDWFPSNQFAIKYNEEVRAYNKLGPRIPMKEMKI